MRIIFMGTPDFAVPALLTLAARHKICAAYTQPPRPGGRRGRELTPSPVHRAALALGIPVCHPTSLKSADAQAEFAAFSADLAVVAAYGLILPPPILSAPALGCLNIHASLLPRWRGAAPIQRAILAGDGETGVTIMAMEAGLDTGPMLLQATTAIGDHDTAGDVAHCLSEMGAELIMRVLGDLSACPPTPQPAEGITYAAKIDKAEARLDFARGAAVVDRQIRAFNPAPGAWFDYAGERIKLLAAEPTARDGVVPPVFAFPAQPGLVLDDQLAIGCGDGAIRPTLVQRAGRPAMAAAEMLRGFPIPPGTIVN